MTTSSAPASVPECAAIASAASADRPACRTTSGFPAARIAARRRRSSPGCGTPPGTRHGAGRVVGGEVLEVVAGRGPASVPLRDQRGESDPRAHVHHRLDHRSALRDDGHACRRARGRESCRCTAPPRPGAMTPMQFGPATARPNSAATSADLVLRDPGRLAASPRTRRPGTTAARTPRFAAPRRTSGTRSIRTAAATASGASGRSSTDGKQGSPSDLLVARVDRVDGPLEPEEPEVLDEDAPDERLRGRADHRHGTRREQAVDGSAVAGHRGRHSPRSATGLQPTSRPSTAGRAPSWPRSPPRPYGGS